MMLGRVLRNAKKATAESVGAIPVSAKDLRQGTNYEDIFSGTLTSNHPCWNKWCRISRNANTDDNAPEPTVIGWYEVFTGGIGNRAFQMAIGCYTHQRKMFIRYMHDNVWTDWIRLIDSTGGTLSGNVAISKNTPTFDLLCASERALRIRCAEDGVVWLNTKKQDSSGYTSLQIHPETASKENLIMLSTYIDNVSTNYKVFGEHNKPTGTYTGNGDATARTIDTGGIGSVCIIYGNNGSMALITPHRSIYSVGTTVGYIISSEVRFNSGILDMTSINAALNASGVTYTYRVL